VNSAVGHHQMREPRGIDFLRTLTIGPTIRSQSSRRTPIILFTPSSLSEDPAPSVRDWNSFDNSETLDRAMSSGMWTGSWVLRMIKALQLYWLALTIMTGPSSAAFWRSENSGCRRKRERSGNIRMREMTSSRCVVSCLICEARSSEGASNILRRRKLTSLNSATKALPMSPDSEMSSSGVWKRANCVQNTARPCSTSSTAVFKAPLRTLHEKASIARDEVAFLTTSKWCKEDDTPATCCHSSRNLNAVS
jgi:hypothetical protein